MAGQINGFSGSSGVASVAGVTIVAPPSPNNDDFVGESPNVLEVTQKHYTGIGPVDIVFEVIPSGGATEYLFLEGVDKNHAFDSVQLMFARPSGNATGEAMTIVVSGSSLRVLHTVSLASSSKSASGSSSSSN